MLVSTTLKFDVIVRFLTILKLLSLKDSQYQELLYQIAWKSDNLKNYLPHFQQRTIFCQSAFLGCCTQDLLCKAGIFQFPSFKLYFFSLLRILGHNSLQPIHISLHFIKPSLNLHFVRRIRGCFQFYQFASEILILIDPLFYVNFPNCAIFYVQQCLVTFEVLYTESNNILRKNYLYLCG